MTSLQVFALFGVPVAAVMFGLLVYFLEGRRPIAKRPVHTPGE